MRTAVIVLLVTAALSAQQAPEPIKIPTQAEWVGPLELRDAHGPAILPTIATIQFSNGAITGEWRIRSNKASGAISGSVDNKSRFHLKVTMFAGGSERQPDGADKVVALERCSGDAVFEGTITDTGVLRLTSDRMRFDTPAKALQGRNCTDLTKLVWTLQQH